MAAVGVKKQFTKFQVLSTIIPPHVIDEVMPLLSMGEAEFDANDSYKQLKHEILRIFGPKQTAGAERALGRILSGKPSTLARQLANDVAKGKLDCDNCVAMIVTLWKRHLSGQVKAGIAHLKVTKDNFKDVCQLADDIHSSSLPPVAVAAISSRPVVSSAPSGAPSLDETQPGLQYPVPEVNAVRNGGRGGRGGRGWRGGRNNRGGRGGQSGATDQSAGASGSSGPRHKGPKHPDLPAGEWKGCSLHYKHGRSAYFCAEPATCPWKNVFISRPQK